MGLYEYSGKTVGGSPVSGTVEGRSPDEVKRFLRRQRIVVSSVKKKSKPIQINIGTGVKSIDVTRFTRQLATMIEAGLPLVQCLTILSEQTSNPSFAKIVGEVRDSVSAGNTFAAALNKHKKIFNQLFVSMIEAGEVGGALEVILKRLADYREKNEAIIRKVKGAMVYPAVILVASLGMTWFMLTFIIPIFAGLFEGLSAELPPVTKFVVSLSDFVRSNMILFILLVIVLIIGYKLAIKNPSFRYQVDKITLQAPVFGDLMKKTMISRFCRTLGTLLESGVNLVEALNVTGKAADNLVMESAVKKAIVGISEGESMTQPLKETKVFPPMVIQMIAVGEKTGSIDTMLSKVAGFYDDEVDAAVSALTSLIEPIVIIFLGIIVGGLMIAMYLPMFDIIGQIQG